MTSINWQKALLQIVVFLLTLPLIGYLGGLYYDLSLWIVSHTMNDEAAKDVAKLMMILYGAGSIVYAAGGFVVLGMAMFESDMPDELKWLSCRTENQ